MNSIRRTFRCIPMGVLLFPLLVGCGGGTEEGPAATPAGGAEQSGDRPHGGGSVVSEVASTEISTSGERTGFVPPFPGNADPFAPPAQIPIVEVEEPEPEPAPEIVRSDNVPLPPLRLLGFVDVKGTKALLSLDGEVKLVGAGDVVAGVQVTEATFPHLTLKHRENQVTINLFQQDWQNMPTGRSVQPASTAAGGGGAGGRNLSTGRSASDGGQAAPRLPQLPPVAPGT
jgi:hypothetical protein